MPLTDAEPKLCPHCPMSASSKQYVLDRLKDKQYTRTKEEPSPNKICIARRLYLQQNGEQCPEFPKTETLLMYPTLTKEEEKTQAKPEVDYSEPYKEAIVLIDPENVYFHSIEPEPTKTWEEIVEDLNVKKEESLELQPQLCHAVKPMEGKQVKLASPPKKTVMLNMTDTTAQQKQVQVKATKMSFKQFP